MYFVLSCEPKTAPKKYYKKKVLGLVVQTCSYLREAEGL
jgi:hypothetical protein